MNPFIQSLFYVRVCMYIVMCGYVLCLCKLISFPLPEYNFFVGMNVQYYFVPQLLSAL